jgi:predicted nucleic acid-binding protein
VLILDSSAVLALISPRDRAHKRVATVVRRDPGPFVLSSSCLGEITYLIATRLDRRRLEIFSDDVADGAFVLDCGEADLRRTAELVRRYGDLPLSYADAAVIACAERRRAPVLTLDRDFEVVAREGSISLAP